MLEFLYQTLTKIGYTHPIHPPLTHIPVGMAIGAFFFGLTAWFLRNEKLARSAHYCINLALLGLLPTAVLGYMDWQHFYAGASLFPIKMKLVLAVLLLVLLLIAAILGRKERITSMGVVAVYGLCLLNVTALGYFGGELVFGSSKPVEPAVAEEVQISSERFDKACKACHPGGGNTFKANLPLKSAPQLADFNTFLTYIRSPKARDGSQTIMPPFPADKLSDQQIKEIYRYIVQVLKKQ